MTDFNARRKFIRDTINSGTSPLICESEILAWFDYMENVEKELAIKGGQLDRMIDRLKEARAAAVQWVTYDGRPETLPMQGRMVILPKEKYAAGLIAYLVYGENDHWASITRYGLMRVALLIGDRWAYLPAPPEVK
jgi:hypothetical protein